MAFTAAQISDLHMLLGYPAGYADTFEALGPALEQTLPADTEARIIASITAAKAGIVTADALLTRVGIDADGTSKLNFDRERRRQMGRVRRLIKGIANDLNVEIRDDITNEAPRVGEACSYAPWG